MHLSEWFFGHIMRKRAMESFVITGNINGTWGRDRQRTYAWWSKTVTWSNIFNTSDTEQGPRIVERQECLRHLARHFMMMTMPNKLPYQVHSLSWVSLSVHQQWCSVHEVDCCGPRGSYSRVVEKEVVEAWVFHCPSCPGMSFVVALSAAQSLQEQHVLN